jgi:hypothetical protein
MKLPKKLNNIIDFLGIIIPLIVDLVMNIVSFSILAPDILSRIAFVALAIMIVIFVPRSWAKRQYISYIIFVSVVVFADWSFTLATTTETVTVQEAVINDSELTRLRGNIEKTELKIEDLHKQYYEANKRDTLAELNKQIEFEQSRLNKLEDEYNARLKNTEQKAERTSLSSDDIFMAIPNAIKHKKIIPLIVWFLVFLGTQLVVATSIDNKNESTPASTPAPKKLLPANITEEDIKKWVHISYYQVTNQGNNLILNLENYVKLDNNFDEKKYNIIYKLAMQSGVIDRYGHALIIDEGEAVNRIINI